MAVLDLRDIFQAKGKLLSQLYNKNSTYHYQHYPLFQETYVSTPTKDLGPYLLLLPVTLICRQEMINSINLQLLIPRLFFSKLHRKHFAACPHFVFTSSDLYPQQAQRRHTVASAICFFHTYPITGMQHQWIEFKVFSEQHLSHISFSNKWDVKWCPAPR